MMGGRRSRRSANLLAWVMGVFALWGPAVVTATLLTKPTTAAAAQEAESGLAAYSRGTAAVARIIVLSVVFVEAEEKTSTAEATDEMPFAIPGIPAVPGMPQQPQQPRREISQGSGIVIDPSGYILTNYHVAGNATKVTVRFMTGEPHAARVVGTDPLTDLAVLKVEVDHPLVAARLGDSSQSETGSWVMAAGFPFGGSLRSGRFDEPLRYEPSVTVGVISATHRQSQSDMPGQVFRNLIQTDAPINPGNSGGPLVNDRGEVIGVNQSIFTSSMSGGFIGVGFAIPIDARNKEIIQILKSGKAVVRGQLGISVEPLTDALRNVYHAQSGVFVDEVQPDGPAAKAGVRREDIITKINGTAVASTDELVSTVQMTAPGTEVTLELLREGKPLTVRVTVGRLTVGRPPSKPAPTGKTKLGLTVENLPPGAAQEMGIPGGVYVTAVDASGDGAAAGIRPDDVILKINGHAVDNVQSYQRMVRELKVGQPAVILIWRDGHTSTAQVDSVSE